MKHEDIIFVGIYINYILQEILLLYIIIHLFLNH